MIRSLFVGMFFTMYLSTLCQTDWELKKFEFNNEFVKQYKDSVIRFRYTYDKPEKVIYEWYYWVDTVLHKTRGGYNGKLLDGSYEKFDANGNMLVKGNFLIGLRNWVWKYWNDRGELIRVENWKSGKKDGAFIYYGNNGSLLKEVNYKDGYLNGTTIVYSVDSILSKKYFKKGQLVHKKEGFFKRKL